MATFTTRPEDDAVLKRFTASLTGYRAHIRKIVLFGSRARGDERPWSDYDLLILVDHRDQSLVDGIYDQVVSIQADTGCDLSLKIMSEAEWERRRQGKSSFVANVQREGIVLG
jgi:predicted nucleotidyltransferase